MSSDKASYSIRCGNTWDWICKLYQDIQLGRKSDEQRRICEIIQEVLETRAREVLAKKWKIQDPGSFEIADLETEIDHQRDCVEYLVNILVGRDLSCLLLSAQSSQEGSVPASLAKSLATMLKFQTLRARDSWVLPPRPLALSAETRPQEPFDKFCLRRWLTDSD